MLVYEISLDFFKIFCLERLYWFGYESLFKHLTFLIYIFCLLFSLNLSSSGNIKISGLELSFNFPRVKKLLFVFFVSFLEYFSCNGRTE